MKIAVMMRGGLNALISRISQAQAAADGNASAAAEIASDLQELAVSVNAAIQELNAQKLDAAQVETLISNAITAHNVNDDSHPNHLAVRSVEGSDA